METKFVVLLVAGVMLWFFTLLLFGLLCAPIAGMLYWAAKGFGHPLPFWPIWAVLVALAMIFGRGSVRAT